MILKLLTKADGCYTSALYTSQLETLVYRSEQVAVTNSHATLQMTIKLKYDITQCFSMKPHATHLLNVPSRTLPTR